MWEDSKWQLRFPEHLGEIPVLLAAQAAIIFPLFINLIYGIYALIRKNPVTVKSIKFSGFLYALGGIWIVFLHSLHF